jgi:hypothetical protein
MDIPEYFHLPLLQNFGYRLLGKLEPYSAHTINRQNLSMLIEGGLCLGSADFVTKKVVPCKFVFTWNWIDNPPLVRPSAPWLKRGIADWHIHSDGTLCFEFDPNWTTQLQSIYDETTLGPLSDYAVNWLINSTRSLLRRQLCAHRDNIKDWSPKWEFWPHDTLEAMKIFKKETRNKTRTVPLYEQPTTL